MLDLYHNKVAFIRKAPHLGFIFIVSIFIIASLLVKYVYEKQVYDTYKTKGVVVCDSTCVVITAIPSSLTFEKISINQNFVDLRVIKSEIKVDEANYTTYKELTLDSKSMYQNNEIVELIFYYNQERMITKIKNKMF